MIRAAHFCTGAAALAAALLFGCRTPTPGSSQAASPGPGPAASPQPRVSLDNPPDIGPPGHAVAGWIEWVSPDGHAAVIELAGPVDPVPGNVWWVRDNDLKPLALLAVRSARKGRHVGAIVTHGTARVGAEVISDELTDAPKFPHLQANTSK